MTSGQTEKTPFYRTGTWWQSVVAGVISGIVASAIWAGIQLAAAQSSNGTPAIPWAKILPMVGNVCFVGATVWIILSAYLEFIYKRPTVATFASGVIAVAFVVLGGYAYYGAAVVSASGTGQ